MANSKNTTDYYVYLHRYASGPKVGQVFYVGKGTADRAWQKSGKRNKHWHHIVSKYGYLIDIVEIGYQNWYAVEREIQLIQLYGLNNLCNMTGGGEGGGIERKWSDESRKKLSDSKKGKKQPWAAFAMSKPESRKKLSDSKKGKPAPWFLGDKNPMKNPENVRKMVLSQSGKPRTCMYGSKNPSAKSVICIEENKTFLTQKEAKEWLISIGNPKTTTASNISSAASGKLKKAYGYTWKYADK